MSFLKKLGQVLLAAVGVITGIGPIIGPLLGSKGGQVLGTGVNDLSAIASVIVQIEMALQGKTGPEKLAAAIKLVGPIIRTSQMVSGKKIADPVMLQRGIDEITQGVVDVLNSIHSDSVSTEVHVSN